MDAKLESPTESARCRPDMTTDHQRLDNGQLAVGVRFSMANYNQVGLFGK